MKNSPSLFLICLIICTVKLKNLIYWYKLVIPFRSLVHILNELNNVLNRNKHEHSWIHEQKRKRNLNNMHNRYVLWAVNFFLYYFLGLHLIGTKRNQFIIWIAAWTKGLLQCLWRKDPWSCARSAELVQLVPILTWRRSSRGCRCQRRPHVHTRAERSAKVYSWACMVVGGLHEISMLNISMHQPCKIPTLAN